jgi:hypothetical protein
MDTTAWLFAALLAVAIVGLIALKMVLDRARHARIRQWAGSNGWTVTPAPAAVEWTSRLPGHNRRGVSLILSGKASGWPVWVADYSYETSSAGGPNGETSTTTHRYVVTGVRLALSYPPIAVKPRGGASRLGRAIFAKGADTTGNEEFDRRFQVQTHDPANRALVGPALIHEHLAGQIPTWSLAGQDLLTWEQGQINDPSRVEGRAERLVRVATLLGR